MQATGPEICNAGTYHVLAYTVYNDDYLLTVVRGKKIQLAKVPRVILYIRDTWSEKSQMVLEIKEAGEYKVPIMRVATENEVVRIENYTDPDPNGVARGITPAR